MNARGILAAGVVLLAGCTGPLKLQVRGIKPLNENERKESTPVDVRIYQLRDNARFDRATFNNLWTKAKEELAEDLISEKTVTVFPGAAEDAPREVDLGILDTATRFIGIMALYPREEEGNPRKIAVPVAEADDAIWEFTGYHLRKGT